MCPYVLYSFLGLFLLSLRQSSSCHFFLASFFSLAPIAFVYFLQQFSNTPFPVPHSISSICYIPSTRSFTSFLSLQLTSPRSPLVRFLCPLSPHYLSAIQLPLAPASLKRKDTLRPSLPARLPMLCNISTFSSSYLSISLFTQAETTLLPNTKCGCIYFYNGNWALGLLSSRPWLA